MSGQKPLQTVWETPEQCPHCMEHLSHDWSFCPECGRPTDWAPNPRLTPDVLRRMDGQPVWCEEVGKWGVIWVPSSGDHTGIPIFSFCRDGQCLKWDVLAGDLHCYAFPKVKRS